MKIVLLTLLTIITSPLIAQPINDEPCGALLLPTVTTDCNYTLYSNIGATNTTSISAPISCTGGSFSNGNYAGADVWLKVLVPSTGKLALAINPVGGTSLSNTAMALYTSSNNQCSGVFTQIACNEDYANNLMGFINESGLTPNDTLYIRIWDEQGNQFGDFELCASTPTNDDCSTSLFICDLNGYSGVTSAAYTSDRPGNMCDHNNGAPCSLWPDNTTLPGTQGHSTIDNNSWITFIASSTQAILNISVTNCWKASSAPYNGVQMRAYKATNCDNFIPVSGLEDGINNTRTFTVGGGIYPNLIPGELYYLMIDGFAGDVCSYTITANSGVLVSGIGVTPSPNICLGDSVTLTAIVPRNTGGQTFNWTATPNVIISNSNAQSIKVAPNQSTVFTCVTTGVCGANQTLNQTITISNPPNATLQDTISICEGASVNLSPNNVSGVGTVAWIGGSGVFSPNRTTLNATYTPSNQDITSGLVHLKLKLNSTGSCGSDTIATVLKIVTKPIVTILTSGLVNPISCDTNSIALSTSLGTSISGFWTSLGTGTFSPNNTDAQVSYQPSIQDVNNRTVRFIYTQDNSSNPACSAAKDTLDITLSPKTEIALSNVTVQPVCSGTTISLEATLSGDVTTGSWTTTGTGTFVPNANLLVTSYTPSVQDSANASVNFTFTTGTPSGACPSVDTTFTVSILPAPFVSLEQNPTEFCSGTNIPLVAVVAGSATAVTWTTTGTGAFTTTTSLNTIYTPSAQDIASGEVQITATSNDPVGPCGALVKTLDLIIKPTPQAPITNASPGLAICEKGTVQLTVQSSNPQTTFEWLSSTNISLGTGTSYITPELFDNQTYYVKATLNGCTSDLTRIDIKVNKRPVLPYLDSLKYLICDGFSKIITPKIITPNSIVNWYDAPINGTLVGTGTPFNTGILHQSTNYWIEAVSQEGCSSFERLKVEVEVSPNPDITVTTVPDPAEITFGQILEVHVTPTNYPVYNFYVNDSIKQSSNQAHYSTNSVQNNSVIKVEALNEHGCSSFNSLDADKDFFKIIVHPFPNTFTPNGNGINETYLKGFDLTILNRWGTVLYKGNNGWDGTYEKNTVSAGTYYYIVNIVDLDGKISTINGPVTLLK